MAYKKVQPLVEIVRRIKKKLILVVIIDRSQSMTGSEKAVSDAYTRLMDRIDEKSKSIVTLLFSSTTKNVHLFRSPPEAREISYRVSGTTALYDAVDDAIKLVNVKKQEAGYSFKTAPVLYAILTDGYENCSRRITTKGKIQKVVRYEIEKNANGKLGNRHFIVLADFCTDPTKIAAELGIKNDYTQLYTKDKDGDGIGMAFDFIKKAIDGVCKSTHLEAWKGQTENVVYKAKRWGDIVAATEYARKKIYEISEKMNELERMAFTDYFFKDYDDIQGSICELKKRRYDELLDHNIDYLDNELRRRKLEALDKGLQKCDLDVADAIGKLREKMVDKASARKDIHTIIKECDASVRLCLDCLAMFGKRLFMIKDEIKKNGSTEGEIHQIYQENNEQYRQRIVDLGWVMMHKLTDNLAKLLNTDPNASIRHTMAARGRLHEAVSKKMETEPSLRRQFNELCKEADMLHNVLNKYMDSNKKYENLLVTEPLNNCKKVLKVCLGV